MRILIITFFFPPLNKIASSRPYSWAKYWNRLGHEVVILTKSKTIEDGALNLEYNQEQLYGVTIHELKTWPFRLKRPATEVTFNQPKKRKSIWSNIRAYLHALRAICYSDFWGLSVINKLKNVYKEKPFDIVVSTYGPAGSHIIASYLKKKFKVFWVADYRDLWFGNHARLRKWPFNVFEDKLERKVVRQADLITTVSKGFRDKISKRFRQEVVIIENGFDEEEMPDPKDNEILFPKDGKLRIAYMGTIYDGWQDPSPLFEALALLREEGFMIEDKIEVLFYGSKVNVLDKLINQYNLETVVKTFGFVSRNESLRIQRNVDALLFLEWINPTTGEGLLNAKIYEYFYAGKPVLSIGGNTRTELVTLIETNEAGLSLGKSPQLIADTIEKMINGPGLRYALNKKKMEKYSRKRLAEKMLNMIKERADFSRQE